MGRRTKSYDDEDAPMGSGGGQGAWARPTVILFWGFVLLVAVGSMVPAIPQYRVYQTIKAEHAEAVVMEEKLEARKRQLQRESEALQRNQEYLEARARDPLRRQAEGETVVFFKD